jgi:predicted NUDIX family NTP pyrophosphohydrolase
MANLISAGLLMCRWHDEQLEYFLVHPGGPFFKNKDAGTWTIPKGLPNEGEELLNAAIREFTEETGLTSQEPYAPIGQIKQKRGKIVHAWTFIGAWNEEGGIKSNLFSIEWPPRSGKMQSFPEQDKGAWMNMDRAKEAMITEQTPFLERAREVHLAARK